MRTIGRTCCPRAGRRSDPRTSEYCNNSTSWSGGTQFKALVVMPLPWGIQASANYQNKGPISLPASESFSNSQIAPSLGRDLSACGSRTGAGVHGAADCQCRAPGHQLF